MPQLLLYLLLWMFSGGNQLYRTNRGEVTFESNADLENIKATSTALRGVLNPTTNRFGFTIKMNSFHGFNSSLQMEHYNENYVESSYFPEAVFSGRIIEQIDYSVSHTIAVRAKGDFSLHGITKSVILSATVNVMNPNEILIKSSFNITLQDYGISIPKLVHRKLAEIVHVDVVSVLKKEQT